MSDTRKLLKGIAIGFMAGMIFGVLYLLIYATQGPSRFVRSGLTLGAVIGLWLLAWSLTGLAGGLLSPYPKSRLGAMLVGSVAAIPLVICGELMILPFAALSGPGTVVQILFAAAVLGSMGGSIVWSDRDNAKS